MILGIVAGGLLVLGVIMVLVGGSVHSLNWMLVLGVLVFPFAIILGIVVIIVGVVAASR